jgi:hypothetical protein
VTPWKSCWPGAAPLFETLAADPSLGGALDACAADQLFLAGVGERRASRTAQLVSLHSAMTTAIAFGSLWLSPNPGMSSMGKLMAAVLFQTGFNGPASQTV